MLLDLGGGLEFCLFLGIWRSCVGRIRDLVVEVVVVIRRW